MRNFSLIMLCLMWIGLALVGGSIAAEAPNAFWGLCFLIAWTFVFLEPVRFTIANEWRYRSKDIDQ